MRKLLSLILALLLVISAFQPVFAKEASLEENFFKMDKYFKEKAYNKALKLAAKTKQMELSEKQQKQLNTFMTLAVEYKQLDDIVKYFLVDYNKYEDYYRYKPSNSLFYNMTPYIFSFPDKSIYKIRFEATYYSRTKMYPDLVILYADGKRYEFKPFSSEDTLISYDTHKRRVYAWVNLSDEQAYRVSEATKGNEISFLIKDTNSDKSAEGFLLPFNGDKIRDAYTVYNLLKFKRLKRGQNRF